MELTKFEVEKLSADEMNAIKAGSGASCKTGDIICSSASGDSDNPLSGDCDED
jgi:hypothetical protein